MEAYRTMVQSPVFSSDAGRYAEWQLQLEALLREPERERLRLRVAALEKAIFERLQEIAGRPGHEDERQAIDNAIRKLRQIQREKLAYPPELPTATGLVPG